MKTISKPMFQRLALLTLAAATGVGGLSACVPLVMGGAMAGGVMVALDRRTSGTQLEDEGIELRAGNRLSDTLGDRAHVNVTSYNRQVLLTGEVANAQDVQRAEQIVSRVENVRSIINDLAAMAPTSLSQRSSDAFITGKVKAALVDAKDLQANTLKVVTERGVVYLMGRVTQREANRASDVARGTGSVLKVVRVFEILTEEELQKLGTPNAAPSAAK